MTADPSPADSLAELRELNSLFLSNLRHCVRDGHERFGLPRPAARALAQLPDSALGHLAAFPQALFRLNFDAIGDGRVRDADRDAADERTGSMQLTLLVSLRHLCRQNPFAARLHLRLSSAEVTRIAALAIADIAALASREGLFRCAYRRMTWLWLELLRSPRPDRRRRLILLGLQPTREFSPGRLLMR